MENKTFSTQEELSLNEMTQITASGPHCGDLEDLMLAYRELYDRTADVDAFALYGDVKYYFERYC